MKRGQTVDESHNGLDEKHHLLAQLSGKRSPLGEKHAHPCGEVSLRTWLLKRLPELDGYKFKTE